jgi:hypothetical protein
MMFHCMCSASPKSVAPAFLSTCKLLTKSKKLYRSMRRLQNRNSRTAPKPTLSRKQTNRFQKKLIQRSTKYRVLFFEQFADHSSYNMLKWNQHLNIRNRHYQFRKSLTNPNPLQYYHEKFFCESTKLSEKTSNNKTCKKKSYNFLNVLLLPALGGECTLPGALAPGRAQKIELYLTRRHFSKNFVGGGQLWPDPALSWRLIRTQ